MDSEVVAGKIWRAHPWDRIALKTLRSACTNLQEVIAAGMHVNFGGHLAETERLLAKNDQRGFYKHLKNTVGLERMKTRSDQFIRDENGTLLRDEVRSRERWSGFHHKRLNTKSLKLDPTIIDLYSSRPLTLYLGDEPFVDEMTESPQGMSNWNAVGPDGLLVGVLNIARAVFAQCFRHILVSV